MEIKLLKLQNKANLICGGLLLLLFIFMCIFSYKDYKQKKELPIRLEKLEKQVKELARKIKEKYNEPLPYEPIIEKAEIPEVVYQVAAIPAFQTWDNFACVTGAYIYYID